MQITKTFLATIAAAAVLAADGVIARAGVFRTAPPPPRPVRVVGRSPGRGFVWTNGYWRWGGRAEGTYGRQTGGDALPVLVQYGLRLGGAPVVAATLSLRAAGAETHLSARYHT